MKLLRIVCPLLVLAVCASCSQSPYFVTKTVTNTVISAIPATVTTAHPPYTMVVTEFIPQDIVTVAITVVTTVTMALPTTTATVTQPAIPANNVALINFCDNGDAVLDLMQEYWGQLVKWSDASRRGPQLYSVAEVGDGLQNCKASIEQLLAPTSTAVSIKSNLYKQCLLLESAHGKISAGLPGLSAATKALLADGLAILYSSEYTMLYGSNKIDIISLRAQMGG
ncbi:MAG: hypothetical protein FWH51_04645 [Dehalococcoidia bacterium]|nr:hypothetical protein [Dehalococcoidia bacterium]